MLCVSETDNDDTAVVYFSKKNFDFFILALYMWLKVEAIFFPSEKQLLDHEDITKHPFSRILIQYTLFHPIIRYGSVFMKHVISFLNGAMLTSGSLDFLS
jgi:hypothetical protein